MVGEDQKTEGRAMSLPTALPEWLHLGPLVLRRRNCESGIQSRPSQLRE
jgi:hypothetical protein